MDNETLPSEPNAPAVVKYQGPVVTWRWAKPIPINSFDWSATLDNYQPGCPIGYGATEQEAIEDLKQECV